MAADGVYTASFPLFDIVGRLFAAVVANFAAVPCCSTAVFLLLFNNSIAALKHLKISGKMAGKSDVTALEKFKR